jgi:hypothetical protein
MSWHLGYICEIGLTNELNHHVVGTGMSMQRTVKRARE